MRYDDFRRSDDIEDRRDDGGGGGNHRSAWWLPSVLAGITWAQDFGQDLGPRLGPKELRRKRFGRRSAKAQRARHLEFPLC